MQYPYNEELYGNAATFNHMVQRRKQWEEKASANEYRLHCFIHL